MSFQKTEGCKIRKNYPEIYFAFDQYNVLQRSITFAA